MRWNVSGRSGVAAIVGVAVVWCLTGCTPQPDKLEDVLDGGSLSQTLFVGHDGVLVSYDIATGSERPGTLTAVTSPTDLQSLEDGTLLLNLTSRNEVLAVNGKSMLELARIPSSSIGAARPVHGFVSPERGGRRYWVALNDGQGGDAATNSARFISVAPGPGYLQPQGEVRLGVGHHKAAFSATRERVVISSIADCNAVLGVYDYSDIAAIRAVKVWSAFELGWDGSSAARTCNASNHPMAPHGCATSKVSGKVYCNLTGSGQIAVITPDAALPAATLIATGGSGAGYTKASRDGRYIYSLQEKPREGASGGVCQIGQLVTVDARTDAVVSEAPLLYGGPSCASPLAGTDEESAEPGHILLRSDGKRMYVGTAGGFGLAGARVRRELVLDLTDPSHPLQLPSLPTGASSGHHGDGLSGDGRYLFVANNQDGTVTQVDTVSETVVRDLAVRASPEVVATFGSAEGPGPLTGPVE